MMIKNLLNQVSRSRKSNEIPDDNTDFNARLTNEVSILINNAKQDDKDLLNKTSEKLKENGMKRYEYEFETLQRELKELVSLTLDIPVERLAIEIHYKPDML